MQASCSRRSEESLCAHACTYGDRMVLRCRARASALWLRDRDRRSRTCATRKRPPASRTCRRPPQHMPSAARAPGRTTIATLPLRCHADCGPAVTWPAVTSSHVLVPRKTSDRPLDGAFGATGRLRPPARRRSRPLPTLYTRYAPGPGVCAARWSRRSWSKRASLPNERAG